MSPTWMPESMQTHPVAQSPYRYRSMNKCMTERSLAIMSIVACNRITILLFVWMLTDVLMLNKVLPLNWNLIKFYFVEAETTMTDEHSEGSIATMYIKCLTVSLIHAVCLVLFDFITEVFLFGNYVLSWQFHYCTCRWQHRHDVYKDVIF